MGELVILLLLCTYVLLLASLKLLAAQDTLPTNGIIKDGETIVSAQGNFELGFFSPGNSQSRYVGIWYKKVSTGTVVWIANRNTPLQDKSGVLTITSQANLNIIDNLTNTIIWSSSNSSTSSPKFATTSPVAQLLDTGNLAVKDEKNNNSVIWQSFDYPTDTLLPGMQFGIDSSRGLDRYIASWKGDGDPAEGEFVYRCDPQGYPQFFITDGGSAKVYRLGPWNGITFSGNPKPGNNIYTLGFVNDNGVYYIYETAKSSVFSRIVLNQNGVLQRKIWIDENQGWVGFLNAPADICDTYGKCGTYGSCNLANSRICECMTKFVPTSTKDWNTGDYTKGCVREKPLDCPNDGFLKYSNIKLPDTRSSWSNETTTLKACEIRCLENCSCSAYTTLDISKGSGCLLWFGDLIDIRQIPQGGGQDIYIRMASSELGGSKGKKNKTIIISLIVSMGTILICLGVILFVLKKKEKKNETRYMKEDRLRRDAEQFQSIESQQQDLELPLINLHTIQNATNYFCMSNKLGEGGFGPVYKGVLEDGKEIAVKRLSKNSRQGTDEFKNEVVCIAKLQHRNLVKLLGCCIQEDEKMLVYEYLPNRGLDFFIFDESRSILLDWPTRFNIINGIARGLLYLHQDSRLRVIHRDLKVSNILLDKDLNPKISDFGMARIFGGDEKQANTNRVVGTYGYMSPEYQLDGLFSDKSDVFSFGVLVLEIVSGKKNRRFFHPDHNHNLLGHAWNLFKEGMSEELINEQLLYSGQYLSEILRSIHIGLLCVQQDPKDRPNMSYVVMMLGNDIILPQPKRPGFYAERNKFLSEEASSSQNISSSYRQITVTQLDAR